MARPRSSGLNDSSSTACDSGCSAPPVAPCRMRKITSAGRFGASPHSTDATVNPAVETINSRLRPSTEASHPVNGRMIALATRYDVNAHVASSVVAAMLLAMCGSDTFTTVVSSTSMKVTNITTIATIQGLTGLDTTLLGIHSRRHRHARPEHVLRILTGVEHDLHRHALHHFHEVAARVLRREQAEPRACRRRDAVDLPSEAAASVRINVDLGPLTGSHVLELRLLEVGGHPDLFERNDRHHRLTGLDNLTGLHRLSADDALHGGFEIG